MFLFLLPSFFVAIILVIYWWRPCGNEYPRRLTWKKHCSNPWYGYIKNWSKGVEGRIRRGDWMRITKGDLVHFYCDEDPVGFTVLVTYVVNYASYEEYLKHETVTKCLPGITNINEALKIYRGFRGYSKADEDTYGVVGVHFD
jgi:ASC-1-like (ASCH) protein